MKFEIPGNPIPKARHRSYVMRNKVMTYDPQGKEKDRVKEILSHELDKYYRSEKKEIAMEASNLTYSDVLGVSLVFLLPYPKSRNTKQKNRILWGLDEANEKPDIDNLAKFYLDCANGVLYSDDKKIVFLKAEKQYSRNPKTIINIMPENKIKLNETAEKILETIDPREFSEFIVSINNLMKFSFDVDDDSPNSLKTKRKQAEYRDIYQQRLLETAGFISLFAEKYSVFLTNIRKKWPHFHESCENIKKTKEDFKTGAYERL